MSLKIRNFIMKSGERYCLLVDRHSGLPLYYPNLYITTQVRNRSLSVSAMTTALGGIGVLLQFMAERGGNLDSRFSQQAYLEIHELDAIRDFCQRKFRFQESHNNLSNLVKLSKFEKKVSKDTEYSRLSSIANYVEWLANTLAGPGNDKLAPTRVSKMAKGLRSRRPPRRGKNQNEIDKALDERQIELVFEIFRPGSELNPFKEHQIQIRNRIIFLMLYHLGLRGGELLNIRIRDIDLSKNQLVVARRADEKNDPRTYQPLVKTLDRRLPMKETLAKEIHDYIVKVRKSIPNANRHDFLFVTHKSGPTQGQPISISGYKKVIETVRMAAPSLSKLTGHQLRHTWNDSFSKKMDLMDESPSEGKQEQMRSYLMGWKTGSGTAATYNKRFIKNKAHEASLSLQKDIVRLPKGELSNEGKYK